ncbi:MAG: DUF89 family protein [Anaerolineaceae bacterium]|nr:DUF89 family protein [Anaerolineaceae bacterium]
MEKELMRGVLHDMSIAADDAAPIEVIGNLMGRLHNMGYDDPFIEIKEQSSREALKLYPRMKELVAAAPDPLEMALHLAIVGNAIDFGIYTYIDPLEVLEDGLHLPFMAPDLETLRGALHNAEWILYLADNTGETVFDRVLIETINKPVRYAVKSGYALNDVTRRDALRAGIDTVAEIVENGDHAPGTVPERVSAEFEALYRSAPLILSKGMGNYEGLSECDWNEEIFYLFKVKCQSMSTETGAPINTLLLKKK